MINIALIWIITRQNDRRTPCYNDFTTKRAYIFKMSGNLVNSVMGANLCMLLILGFSGAFNLDPKSAVLYEGTSGSYFGYSVGILENKDGIL